MRFDFFILAFTVLFRNCWYVDSRNIPVQTLHDTTTITTTSTTTKSSGKVMFNHLRYERGTHLDNMASLETQEEEDVSNLSFEGSRDLTPYVLHVFDELQTSSHNQWTDGIPRPRGPVQRVTTINPLYDYSGHELLFNISSIPFNVNITHADLVFTPDGTGNDMYIRNLTLHINDTVFRTTTMQDGQILDMTRAVRNVFQNHSDTLEVRVNLPWPTELSTNRAHVGRDMRVRRLRPMLAIFENIDPEILSESRIERKRRSSGNKRKDNYKNLSLLPPDRKDEQVQFLSIIPRNQRKTRNADSIEGVEKRPTPHSAGSVITFTSSLGPSRDIVGYQQTTTANKPHGDTETQNPAMSQYTTELNRQHGQLTSTDQTYIPDVSTQKLTTTHSHAAVSISKQLSTSATPLKTSSTHVSHKKSCHLETWTVNFAELGWGSWLLLPKTYEANICVGTCYNPLRFLNTTNYAYIKNVYQSKHKYKEVPRLPTVCCSPVEYKPLYITTKTGTNVIIQKLEQMTVTACGCR